MSWEWDERYANWLPEPLAEQIKGHEFERFRRLTQALQGVAESIPDSEHIRSDPAAFLRLGPWLDHVNRFIECRVLYDVDVIAQLYKALEHIVFVAQPFPDLCDRWLSAARVLLDTFRYQLHGVLHLDFQAYWDYYQAMLAPEHSYQLGILGTARALHGGAVLCKSAKNYFAADAARAVWERLIPQLRQPLSKRRVEGLTLLLLFFPHRRVRDAAELPWGEWAREGMALWRSCAHNRFWDQGWLCFFSRLAKHDTHNRIDWAALRQPICSRAIWFFEVPIGDHFHMRAEHPQYPYAHACRACIANGGNPAGHLAKVLSLSMRTGSSSGEGSGTSSQECIQTLASMLGHYYHANTAGRWSVDLARLLTGFAHSLVRRRLPGESSASWCGAAATKLDPAAIAPVADTLIELALTAMHHKSAELQGASLEAVTNFVYFSPQRTLRAVFRRLLEALEATNATHQLSTAINALAGVVRPLLLHGLHPEPPSDGAMDSTGDAAEPFAAQRLACEELGAVMIALLPGIDANDAEKTTATIALYLSVLSNCVAFTGRDYPPQEGEAVLELGFYAEEFVLGFLQRLFGLMQDVDVSDSTADGTSQTHGHSWVGRCSMLQPMLDELFAKMPDALVDTATRKVREFVLAAGEPQLADDAGMVLTACIARRGGDAAANKFLRPLLDAAEASAKALVGTSNPSKAQTKRISAQLALLRSTVVALGPAAASHADALLQLAFSATHVADNGVIAQAVSVLGGLARALTEPTLDTCSVDVTEGTTLGVPDSLNGAVARWVARDMAGAPRVKWQERAESDHRRCREVLEACMREVHSTLDAMQQDGSISDPGHAARLRLSRAVELLAIIVFCFQKTGPSGPHTHARPDAEGLAGAADADVDSTATCACAVAGVWEGCTLQERAGEAAVAIADKADPGNTLALLNAVHTLRAETGAWLLERARTHRGTRTSSYKRLQNESCVADLLLGAPVATHGRFDRQPYWVTRHLLEWHRHMRAAHSIATPWPSCLQPQLRMAQVHPRTRAAAAALLRLSRHRYPSVAAEAARALGAFSAYVSREFAECVLPAAFASAALLPGYDAEPTVATSAEDAAARLDETLQQLTERVQRSLRGEAPTEGAPGACDSGNKHLVLGGLQLLGAHRSSLLALVSTSAPHCAALYLSLLVHQTYHLPEVKMAVSRFMSPTLSHVARPSFACAAPLPPASLRVTELLSDSLDAATAHWRALAIAHLWHAMMAPLPACHGDLAVRTAQRQLRQVVSSPVLLVKDAAMSALNVLFAHPGGASDAVAAAVRSTVATPAVAGGLLAALDAVHSLDWAAPSAKDVAKLAAGRAPETYVPMLLQELARSDFSRFGTLVCRTPALKGRAPPTGPAPGVRRHVAGFAAALCRMAPAETLAALRQPLTDWSELTPKEEALEPSTEYTCMEICYAAITSCAAFAPDAQGQGAPWDAWLRPLILARWNAASVAKGKVWGAVLALAVRSLAERCSEGASGDEAPAEALRRTVEFVGALSEGWLGDSSADGKRCSVVLYTLDHLMQVQATAPCGAAAAALESVLQRSQALTDRACSHSLQMVRDSGSCIAAVHLATVRSPGCLLPSDGAARESERAMVASIRRAFEDASAALHGANGANGAMATGAETAEPPIGYAAALADSLTGLGRVMHLIQDVMVLCVPWAAEAQALQHPALKALTAQLRETVTGMSSVVLTEPYLGQLTARLIACSEAKAWQARGSALGLLQCFWFRCALRAVV